MIKEISYLAKPKNKKAKSVMLGLLGSSIILVAAATWTPKYSGIVWVFALAFITATIYVYNRYVGAEYVYEIIDPSRPSFVIGMRVGKTARTMARLDLYAIKEIRRLTKEEYRKYKPEKGILKYPYYPTMFSDEIYLLSVRSDYENADVFIEADSEFIAALDESIKGM